MTGAVVGAALLTNMILLNSVRASDRGWQHLIGERDWEEKMAMLKEDRIERDKKLQQKFSTAVNNLDGKIEDLKGGLNKKKYKKKMWLIFLAARTALVLRGPVDQTKVLRKKQSCRGEEDGTK